MEGWYFSMGWHLDEIITKYSCEEDHAGRDIILQGNSVSDTIILKQDEDEIVLDPLQIRDIYNRLVDRSII